MIITKVRQLGAGLGLVGLLMATGCCEDPESNNWEINPGGGSQTSVEALSVLLCPSADAALSECTAAPQRIYQTGTLELRLVSTLEGRVSTPCAVEWVAMGDGAALGQATQRIQEALQGDAPLTVSLAERSPRFTLTLQATSVAAVPDERACYVNYGVATTFNFDVRTCPEGLSDAAGDGVDSNCDGIDGEDVDSDGVASVETGGLDCSEIEAVGDACRPPDAGVESALWEAPSARLSAGSIPGEITRAECEALPAGALGDCPKDTEERYLSFSVVLELFLEAFFGVSDDGYLNDRIADESFAVGMSWLEAPMGGFDLALFDLLPAPQGGEVALDGSTLLDAEGHLSNALLDLEVAEDGSWRSQTPGRVRLYFPFGDARLPVNLHRVYGAGRVTFTEEGARVEESTLYGVVVIDEINDSLNAYAREACPCLELGDADLFDLEGDSDGKALADRCDDESEASCARLASGSKLIAAILEELAELDLNGDGTLEATPAAIRLEATPASFSTIATP